MAWGGNWAGVWPGAWGGLVAQVQVRNMVGAVALRFQAYVVVQLPADRFAWGAVLTGPAGYDNAALGRMALRTRRRR